jgi:DNA-binding CsgD family transcriptional regulator
MKQARTALDAFGQATLAIAAASGKLVWQTPLARDILHRHFAEPGDYAPERLLAWTRDAERARRAGQEAPALVHTQQGCRLLASFHDQTGDEEWLVVLREENDDSTLEALISAFRLTRREAEVLHWLTLGKTNRDIADILGGSPRTVNKHLEHIFEKLGVETRTAAATLAVNRLRGG